MPSRPMLQFPLEWDGNFCLTLFTKIPIKTKKPPHKGGSKEIKYLFY